MKIAIGCDEAAYSLKKIIIDHLSNRDDVELKDLVPKQVRLFYTLMLQKS